MRYLSRFYMIVIAFMLINSLSPKNTKGQTDDTRAPLATPSPAQYLWHEQERLMFVAMDPATWQGREYDNHSTPLSEINPTMLDTDQWCQVATSWGAKQILFVAKHTGGFCWWQTQTSNYGIKETPWRDGKGDVLADLAVSCRKHGLNLGIYVYPGDDTWGAPMGSGGKTRDPDKQEAYNKVFRQQLTEVLTRYGRITEVWFDGSCVIEVGDILEKYASDAVIFQGPHATIRWVGNERGHLPYPAWNALKKSDLETGVSTALHSNPGGDAWAPLEADTTLYDHYWFWSPEKEKKRKSLDDLMEIYYKSVGRGGVLLLNSTPDTTGLIPADDVKAYRTFAQEIERRFGTSVAETKGRGDGLILELGKPTSINHAIIMEDYWFGERVCQYALDAYINSDWQQIVQGISVGRMKIDVFQPITTDRVRLRVLQSAAEPLIRRLAVFHVDDVVTRAYLAKAHTTDGEWKICGSWDPDLFKQGATSLDIDLGAYITEPNQYEVEFIQTWGVNDLDIQSMKFIEDGDESLTQRVTALERPNTFNLNRTAAVTPESRIVLRVILQGKGGPNSMGIVRIRAR